MLQPEVSWNITVAKQVLLQGLNSAPKLMMGDTEMCLDSEDLDEYHIEKAAKELRETPERVEESFKILCDMLAEEEDLHVPLDLDFLIKFLRTCKWYPRSTFKLIKRYYEYRRKHPEYFALPSNEHAIFTSGILTPLPRRCNDGIRVLVIEAGRKWNPKLVSLNQIFKGVLLQLEVATLEAKTQVSGVRVIMDMEGLSLSHVTYFTPSFASAVIEFVRKSLPCRLKGVHIVNYSFIFNMVFAVFKPFINGKLRERIYFHDADKLPITKFFDKKALPIKYGGEFPLPSEPLGEVFWEYTSHFDNYFREYNKFGYAKE